MNYDVAAKVFLNWINLYGNPRAVVSEEAVNWCDVDDPWVDAKVAEIKAALDSAEQTRLLLELDEYIIENQFFIHLPIPYVYTFWQPWVVNFHGVFLLGRDASFNFSTYVGVDKAMKKEATGR